MSGAFSSLFGIASAEAAGANFINSYDADMPGGVAQVPVGSKFQSLFPGDTGIAAGSNLGNDVSEIGNLGTQLVTPSASPSSTPSGSTTAGGLTGAGPGLDVSGNPCNSLQTYLALGGCGNSDGTAGAGTVGGVTGAVQGLTGMGTGAASSAITVIEELFVRGMLILVGIVLIGAGFYLAGARGRDNIVAKVVGSAA